MWPERKTSRGVCAMAVHYAEFFAAERKDEACVHDASTDATSVAGNRGGIPKSNQSVAESTQLLPLSRDFCGGEKLPTGG
jgi:hypothetical protein